MEALTFVATLGWLLAGYAWVRALNAEDRVRRTQQTLSSAENHLRLVAGRMALQDVRLRELETLEPFSR